MLKKFLANIDDHKKVSTGKEYGNYLIKSKSKVLKPLVVNALGL